MIDCSCVAHYLLDASPRDISGGNNHGTVTGAVPARGFVRPGSYRFDGTDDFIGVADHTSLRFANGTSQTISVWVKPQFTNLLQTLVSKGRFSLATDDYTLYIGVNDPGFVRYVLFQFQSAGAYSQWYTNAPIFGEAGRWYHVVWSYTFGTATSARLYLDGRVQAGAWNLGTGSEAPLVRSDLLYLGGQNVVGGYWPLEGSLRDVRIYRRILSPAEIGQLYVEGCRMWSPRRTIAIAGASARLTAATRVQPVLTAKASAKPVLTAHVQLS